MKPNPYGWQSHHPRQAVGRGSIVSTIAEHLRRGKAVKIVGGRGMGKSVLLQQLEKQISTEPSTRVVRVNSAPEEATVPGAVRDLAALLGVLELSSLRMDDLLARVIQGDVTRLVLLFDEADQYVASGGAHAAFARSWFNKLEATRRQWDTSFSVVFAGGLGLVFLERDLGSAIVSRAEPCVLEPFRTEDIEELAIPFREDGRALDDTCLETLAALSGGIPALVTYGLEQLWELPAPRTRDIEDAFVLFRERHDSFLRSIQDSVSQRGGLDAPWRVLEVVREDAGSVPLQRLRDACSRPDGGTTVDPKQALDLLRAAGLIRTEGSLLADPIIARPIASILNLPDNPAGSGEPIERLIQDVCTVLANQRRFGRDFHAGKAPLEEDVFASMLAVALCGMGWPETDREAIQAGGYTDLKVRLLTRPGLGGHALIEVKLWPRNDYQQVQKQIDDYRVADTRHGIVVVIGMREALGWAEAYEETCLMGREFERLETPPDLIGRWRVSQTDPDGRTWLTDHLLVQIPKRN